jgi:ferric-dicitrate binding protein FerR (iron transport regulator)
MDKNRLHTLIQKYINQTATAAEQEELNNWYRQHNEESEWEYLSAGTEERAGEDILQHLNQHLGYTAQPPLRRRMPFYAGLAAASLAILTISTWWYFSNNARHFSQPVADLHIATPAQTTENRFVVLPDSSTVILHPGSHITYHNSNKTRELVLEGEAYFDIRQRTDQPFVIRTGKVKTTVMGTTFNIKAYSADSITVSVISGSVKVTDAKNNAAVLRSNQEAVYNNTTNLKKQEQPLIAGTIAWTKSDMQFQDMPYAQLAERLSRRYDVNISFRNPVLEKCPITGRFSGTETLREVLEILSQTMGTTYTMQDQQVELDGSGCF